MPDLSFINDVINSLIEYFNTGLEMLGLGIQVTGKFDYNGIVEAITGLFSNFDLGSLLGG